MASTTAKKTTSTRKTAAKKTETKAAEPEVIKEEPIQQTEEPKKESDLEALVKAQAEMIEQLKAQLEANKSFSVANTDNREKVTFLWQAPVADYNVIEFGENGRFGRIMGNSGKIMIPKNELSQVMDTKIRYYMDMRWLIILSGLDEQEREMFGVNYKEGEYLSKEVFMNVIGCGEEILEIYPKLCEAHKEIVAKFYYEAWRENRGVKREIVVALNKICKNDAFKAIIEEMNEMDASEE